MCGILPAVPGAVAGPILIAHPEVPDGGPTADALLKSAVGYVDEATAHDGVQVIAIQ